MVSYLSDPVCSILPSAYATPSACPPFTARQWAVIAMVKHRDQNNSGKKSRQELKRGRNLKAGANAETTEECCSLACFSVSVFSKLPCKLQASSALSTQGGLLTSLSVDKCTLQSAPTQPA